MQVTRGKGSLMTQLELTGRGACELSAPQKVLAVVLSIVLAVGLSPLGQVPSKAYAEGGLQAASVDEELQTQNIVASVTNSSGETTEYSIFLEAVFEAEPGDTVTLLQDVGLDNTLVVDKKLTIDLNGKTLSGYDNATIVATKGTSSNSQPADLTIKSTEPGGVLTNKRGKKHERQARSKPHEFFHNLCPERS